MLASLLELAKLICLHVNVIPVPHHDFEALRVRRVEGGSSFCTGARERTS